MLLLLWWWWLLLPVQERVQIQKYVCQGCTHTWRSDD